MVLATVVGGAVVVVGALVVVGCTVVVGGAVEVVGGAVVVGDTVVVTGAAVVVLVGASVVFRGCATALNGACALQRGVSQQLKEQLCIAPPREAFTMLHPSFQEHKKPGKHPLELMNSFRAPSKACRV